MFGMLTGTASTGMILLREIDPNYETPAANNLVLQQVPAIAFGAPLLLLMSFAAESMTNSLIVFGIMIGMFIVYNIVVFRKYIFKKKNTIKNIDYETSIFIDNHPEQIKILKTETNNVIRIRRKTDKYSKVDTEIYIKEYQDLISLVENELL